MTADIQTIQFGGEAVMPHPVKCSSYVESNDESVLFLV